jgi:hypothetical protein
LVDHPGLLMVAYQKFSDAMQSQIRAASPPKPAKAPKAGLIEAAALGDLGALGEAERKVQNSAPPIAALDRDLAIWGEAKEERTAIVEYDGNITPAWAEGFARLHPDRPPGDVSRKRWLTFLDDIGRFLDSPFCAVAAALGWGPHDLFGCDGDRPFARIDHAGLLWLLNGDKLIALAENAATIERRTGARQTYRRKPCGPSRVLAWELPSNG